MLRVLIAMTMAAASAAVGQILVRRGMQQIGSLENYGLINLMSYFWQALSNPYVLGGTVLNAIFYFLFLAALSWSGVTVVLPLTAIEYVFAAALAVIFLKEQVSAMRWGGIVLVIVGIILITRSGGDT